MEEIINLYSSFEGEIEYQTKKGKFWLKKTDKLFIQKGLKIKKLKTYCWNDILKDHSSGMVVVVASSLKEARAIAIENSEFYGCDCNFVNDLKKKPIVKIGRCAFFCSGGG